MCCFLEYTPCEFLVNLALTQPKVKQVNTNKSLTVPNICQYFINIYDFSNKK